MKKTCIFFCTLLIATALSAQTNDKKEQKATFAPCEPHGDPIDYKINYTNVVLFRINSCAIDKDQEIGIYNTAEALEMHPYENIHIIGYADKQSGSETYNMILSEKRARNVAKFLIEKHNIRPDRIYVEWRGSTEQPYTNNEWNRVVIFGEK